MSINDKIDDFRTQWAVVSKAPAIFVLCLIAIIGVTWGIFSFLYSTRIGNYKSTIELQGREIESANRKIQGSSDLGSPVIIPNCETTEVDNRNFADVSVAMLKPLQEAGNAAMLLGRTGADAETIDRVAKQVSAQGFLERSKYLKNMIGKKFTWKIELNSFGGKHIDGTDYYLANILEESFPDSRGIQLRFEVEKHKAIIDNFPIKRPLLISGVMVSEKAMKVCSVKQI